MIHIKETEIIPLLKEAQTEYSQKITEGDPKDVEMAERPEPTQVDIDHWREVFRTQMEAMGESKKGKDRQPDLQMAERPRERLSQI